MASILFIKSEINPNIWIGDSPNFFFTKQRKKKGSKARSANLEKPNKNDKHSLDSENKVKIQSGERNSKSINKAAKAMLEPTISRKSLESLKQTAKRRDKRDTEGKFNYIF